MRRLNWLSKLFCMCLLIATLAISASAAENTTEFAGGEGTEENPYLIANTTHLNNVRNYLSAHFKMTADIIFTDTDSDWVSIGDETAPFTGSFDGDGYTISGLRQNISAAATVYGGLFGCASGTTIENLGVVKADISVTSTSGDAYAGGIVGYASANTINNCYNTGIVTAMASDLSWASSSYAYAHVGGIIGDAGGGTIIRNCYNLGAVTGVIMPRSYVYVGGVVGKAESTASIGNCYNTGAVLGESTYTKLSNAGGMVGGIIGHANDNAVSRCYNTGVVTALISAPYSSASTSTSVYAGGIIGYASRNTISECYSDGAVTASILHRSYAYAGGIVGRAVTDTTLRNCYNTGFVTASSSFTHAGGIAGDAESDAISNCYYLDICSSGVDGGWDSSTKCSVEQMRMQSTYAGFDFTEIWTMDGNGDYLYPELVGVPMIFTKEVEFIEIFTEPTKLEYLEVKEKLDVTGGEIAIFYNNGTSEVASLTSDMVNGFDNTTVGKQTLTVTYEGSSTTFEIRVIAKSASAITLVATPNKLIYENGEKLDATGGQIAVYYDNDTSDVIDITVSMIKGFNSSIAGEQTLTVRYSGFTATFNVKINEKWLTSITVTTLPTKLTYMEATELLDVTGGKLTLQYSNGMSETIELTADMVSGFDSAGIGKQILTVTYEGFTDTFDIEVLKNPIQLSVSPVIANKYIVLSITASKEISTQVLACALYSENGRLLGFTIVLATEPYTATTVVLTDNAAAKTAKVFLWDSPSTTTPIADAVEVTIR